MKIRTSHVSNSSSSSFVVGECDLDFEDDFDFERENDFEPMERQPFVIKDIKTRRFNIIDDLNQIADDNEKEIKINIKVAKNRTLKKDNKPQKTVDEIRRNISEAIETKDIYDLLKFVKK